MESTGTGCYKQAAHCGFSLLRVEAAPCASNTTACTKIKCVSHRQSHSLPCSLPTFGCWFVLKKENQL